MPAAAVALLAAVAGAGATWAVGPFVVGALGKGLLATLVSTAIGGIVAAGVSYAASSILGLNRPQKASAAAASDRRQMIRSPVAPRQIVMGVARVSGPIVYASSSGADSRFLHLVIPVAAHQIAGFDAVWLGDTRIPAASLFGDGFVALDEFSNQLALGTEEGGYTTPEGVYRVSRVRVRLYDGAQTAADSLLVAASTDGWGSAHVLRGVAYVYVRLDYNRDVFPNGPPNISVEIRGKNTILDPRSNTTGYSANAALCILDYLRSADGLACADDEIDLDSFRTAANICDEQVQIAATGATQPRYHIGGGFTLDRPPIEIMEELLGACGGTLVYVQGRYRLHVGAYSAPTDTLTVSDLAGEIELQTKAPRRELFNSVRGTFIDPTKNWQAADFPPVAGGTYVTEDGGEAIWRNIDLPFTTDATRAQRLATMALRRAREALTVRAPVRYAGIRYSVWQMLSVTIADFGWTAKPFRITAWTFNPETGIVTLTLREESAFSYAWTYNLANSLGPAPDTDLVNPLNVPAPTGVALSATTSQQPDGSVVPALLVTWTAAPFAFTTGHEVQWRVTGGAAWDAAQVPVETNRFVISPVLIGTTYDVRVRTVTGTVRSAWSGTVSSAAAADSTAPGVPTALSATGVTRGISLSWTLPTAPDLAAVEVWENTSNSTAGRYFVGETRGTGFLRSGLNPNATRWFWVRARDLSGNASAFAGPVSAASTLLVADDIQNGILNTAKFAAGIQPVEYGAALPTTGNFEGRYFYRTSDATIWKYLTPEGGWTQTEGGNLIAWPNVVAGAVRAAAISATEIAAGSIKAINLASETLITQAAQLGAAVVTTAKIGDLQVETIKVAGNAITATSGAAWSSTYQSTTWGTLATVVIGDSFGGAFTVLSEAGGTPGQYTLDAGEGGVNVLPLGIEVRVLRNGTVLAQGTQPIAVRLDSPGTGSHTYQLQARSQPMPSGGTLPVYATVTYGVLIVQQAKR